MRGRQNVYTEQSWRGLVAKSLCSQFGRKSPVLNLASAAMNSLVGDLRQAVGSHLQSPICNRGYKYQLVAISLVV